MTTGGCRWPWLSLQIRSKGWVVPSAMVISIWGTIGGWAAIKKEDPGLQISIGETSWHLHAVGNITAVPKPIILKVVGNIWGQLKCWGWWLSPAVLGRWDGMGWSLRLVTAQARGSGMPAYTQPKGPGIPNQGWDAFGLQQLWRGFQSVQNAQTLSGRTAKSGSFGVPTGWKDCPGGQSCERSQTRLTSPNLQGGGGHLFRCQRWGVMPQMWKMTFQCHPPLSVLKGMYSCPFNNMQFGGQDYHMKQPEKTLAYAKVLQHWAEKAQPPMPGKPHQLAECVWELREAVEPLTAFTNVEGFGNDVPLPLGKKTSSGTSEPAETTNSQEWSCSRNRRACTQGPFVVAHNVGRSKPVTSTQMVVHPQPYPVNGRHLPLGSQRLHSPIGGWYTTCSCRSPTGANQRIGPLGGDHNGHDGLHATTLGFDVRHHLCRHGDLLYESCGFGGYPLGSWLPYACTRGMGRHGFWLRSPPRYNCPFLLVITHPESILNCLIWHSCPTCVYIVFC